MRQIPIPLTLKLIAGTLAGALFMTGGAQAGDDYRYGYSNAYYGGGNIHFVRCESKDFNKRYCDLRGKVRNVHISDRRSRASCHKGKDWDYDRRGIWVRNGCRAIFKVTYRGGGYDYGRDRYRDYDRRDYGDNYGYRDNRRAINRRTAIERCVNRAERRLERRGGRARLDEVTRVRRTDNGWRVGMVFRTRYDGNRGSARVRCLTNRNGTRITDIDRSHRGGKQYSRRYDD